MTRWQLHVQSWLDCKGCELSQRRTNVVLARGSVPCDVLFIGEAPGFSEDILGQPFVGRAGKLLDSIVKRAVPSDLKVGFTNIVACIPKEEDGSKSTEPDHDCIMACQGRLNEFVELCSPELVVKVGKLADEYVASFSKYALKLDREIQTVAIMHPAAILRMPTAGQGLAVQRCVVQIQNAIEALSCAG